MGKIIMKYSYSIINHSNSEYNFMRIIKILYILKYLKLIIHSNILYNLD